MDFCESLSAKDLEFEHIFLSLRTYVGIDLEAFKNRFQSEFKTKYKSIISPLLKARYAEFNGKGFRLTRKGMILCDEILPAFSTNYILHRLSFFGIAI